MAVGRFHPPLGAAGSALDLVKVDPAEKSFRHAEIVLLGNHGLLDRVCVGALRRPSRLTPSACEGHTPIETRRGISQEDGWASPRRLQFFEPIYRKMCGFLDSPTRQRYSELCLSVPCAPGPPGKNHRSKRHSTAYSPTARKPSRFDTSVKVATTASPTITTVASQYEELYPKGSTVNSDIVSCRLCSLLALLPLSAKHTLFRGRWLQFVVSDRNPP